MGQEGGGYRPFDAPKNETWDPALYISMLNGPNKLQSSLFGETYSDALYKALYESKMLVGAMKTKDAFEENLCGSMAMNAVVKVMKTRAIRKKERDFFFVEFGDWDMHEDAIFNLIDEMLEFNNALQCFVDYAWRSGLWDDITIVAVSEFGRTLAPNSNDGTDHAGAGNYFVASGGMKGGKIIGQYPILDEKKSDMVLERGRIIPQMSFETMWAPIMEWMGIQQADFDHVIPNWNNTGSPLMNKTELYDSTEGSISREYVTYGSPFALRVEALPGWLENDPHPGEDVLLGSSSGFGRQFYWYVRSDPGTGNRSIVDDDPRYPRCVRYGEPVYILSDYVEERWLSGGVTGDMEGVLTGNILTEENATLPHYQWVFQSYYEPSFTYEEYDTIEPKHLRCIKTRDRLYIRLKMDTNRWLAGGGMNTSSTGTTTNVQTIDARTGVLEESYFRWFFEN